MLETYYHTGEYNDSIFRDFFLLSAANHQLDC